MSHILAIEQNIDNITIPDPKLPITRSVGEMPSMPRGFFLKKLLCYFAE
jgi:hypothetical protein